MGSLTGTQHITTTTADIASRRVLRLALGTGLSMAFSQVFYWPMSFMAAVFTMFMLALPLPAPTLKSGFKFVVALVLPAYGGMLLLPFLEYARWAGVLLVMMALFGSFYYSARGGSPIMGMFMTMGVTLVVTIGSVSADMMLMAVNGIAIGAAVGITFVVLAHGLLPDVAAQQAATPPAKPPQPPRPPAYQARRNAFRSWVVVLPLVIIFLFSSSSTSYIAVMIKVASMGQQANAETSRSMGMEQLESTVWGGIAAIVAWHVMGIWPSLLILCLLIGLACLLFGARIFQGPGMHPKGGMWSYALLTMIILITPAVMDSPAGSDATAAFYTRLFLFVVIALYGTISVLVFDTFWPAKHQALAAEK